jgi:hypothetical protein
MRRGRGGGWGTWVGISSPFRITSRKSRSSQSETVRTYCTILYPTCTVCINEIRNSCRVKSRDKERGARGVYHRVHRVATVDFWRTFRDEGIISPGWWGWGVHAHPLSLHLPSPVKLQCTLQWADTLTLFHLYMYSVVFTVSLAAAGVRLGVQRPKFLGEIQTKILRIFLFVIHSNIYSFAMRFPFHQTHATSCIFLQIHSTSYVFLQFSTVQCKRERRKTIPPSLTG